MANKELVALEIIKATSEIVDYSYGDEHHETNEYWHKGDCFKMVPEGLIYELDGLLRAYGMTTSEVLEALEDIKRRAEEIDARGIEIDS